MTEIDSIHQAARQALLAGEAGEAGEAGGMAGLDLTPAILRAADTGRIHALHALVCRLEPPDAVRPDPPEFFAGVIAGDGVVLGFESADGDLAAYGVLTLPAAEEEHYGRLIGLPVATWPQVAQLEGVAVSPLWRGRDLQCRLGRWRMATAARLGRNQVCATAAPRNFHSWRNLLALGLVMRDLQWLYGGALRYVLHRDLQETVPLRAPCHEVELRDLDRQRTLFRAGGVVVGWSGGPTPEGLIFSLARARE